MKITHISDFDIDLLKEALGFTESNASHEKVLDEVNEKWSKLNELSVGTMSAYRDAASKARPTDRLGKIVKHARGRNQAIDKIAKATGDNTRGKDYARTVEEGTWITKSADGVPKRFRDRDEAEAYKQTIAKPQKASPAPKKTGLDLDTVWQKVEQVIGNIFPDGDPIDWLAPWLEKQGVRDHNIGEVLGKAAKKNGYNDIYAYYDELKNQHDSDNQLNEISNQVLAQYKKQAGLQASNANKAGDMEKGNKRFRGIVQATKKQFDNASKKKVKEKDEDFTSILNKQHADKQALKKTVEIDYHGWTIRYRPAAQPGAPVQYQIMDKRGDVKYKGQASSDKEAVGNGQDWINKGGDAIKSATSNVTIDFNVNFAQEFGSKFYATIDSDKGTPMLIMSTEPQQGFKTAHPRNQQHKVTATTTLLPCITMSAKEANAVGLQANGRYVLGAKDTIDDNTAMFPLIFQSIVQGKGDMMKMGKPGLTVAHNRDLEEDSEPRKGSLRAEVAKNKKEYWDKQPDYEIKDDMVGIAKKSKPEPKSK